MPVGDYEKLNVWKTSHAVTGDVYRATSFLPSRHYWPLGDQMRRAALSVGTNIRVLSGLLDSVRQRGRPER